MCCSIPEKWKADADIYAQNSVHISCNVHSSHVRSPHHQYHHKNQNLLHDQQSFACIHSTNSLFPHAIPIYHLPFLKVWVFIMLALYVLQCRIGLVCMNKPCMVTSKIWEDEIENGKKCSKKRLISKQCIFYCWVSLFFIFI